MKGGFIMKKDSKPNKAGNLYDDGNIPEEDLPKDVIPDDVPRKDGPGGEGAIGK